MSTAADPPVPADAGARGLGPAKPEVPEDADGDVTGRLGYLLKHAQLRLGELGAAVLAPYGISGRELAVLHVLGCGEPASQQEAARRLNVDRTTMVALVDGLETKGLVTRHPHAGDRRKNVVELTETGRVTLRDAGAASDDAERQFLAPLSEPAARQFRQALRTLVTAPEPPGAPGSQGQIQYRAGSTSRG